MNDIDEVHEFLASNNDNVRYYPKEFNVINVKWELKRLQWLMARCQ